VTLVITYVSEESIASIIRVKGIRDLEILAVNVVPSSLMMEATRPPKHRFSQEPHGIISQKMAFFIVITVKTSVLT
jgi:hypothetical protein